MNSSLWIVTFMKFGFFIIGSVCLFLGYHLQHSFGERKKNCTQEVTGVIVDARLSTYRHTLKDHEHRTVNTWVPTYEYTAQGRTIRHSPKTGYAKSEVPVGKTVKIRINPNKPEEYLCELDHAPAICRTLCWIGGTFVFLALASGIVETLLF